MDISITYIFFWNYGGYFEEYVKKNVKIFVSNYFLKVNFQKFWVNGYII